MEILLEHDAWATRQILNAVAALSPEQFHKRFEMGAGSLHDTVTHMLAAQRAWADMLAGRAERPRLEGTQRTAAELSALHEEIAAELAAAARAHPVEEIVSRERGGKVYSFTRGAVVTHVTTHAVHHRAQCLNMLRHVGVEKQPASSVLQWTLETGG
jgi:uncharacterized damage-inducible protein DinB